MHIQITVHLYLMLCRDNNFEDDISSRGNLKYKRLLDFRASCDVSPSSQSQMKLTLGWNEQNRCRV